MSTTQQADPSKQTGRSTSSGPSKPSGTARQGGRTRTPAVPAQGRVGADGPAAGRSPWRGRRGLAVGGLVALAAAGGIAGLVSQGGGNVLNGGSDAGSLNPKAAIPLPDKVFGLSPIPAADDLTQVSSWKQKAADAGRGAAVVGRTYGTGAVGARTVRLVVGRTDLTGQLEQAWAAPGAGQKVGEATCTNNTVIAKNTAPRIRPTVMLCWRTSAALSAYSLIIDPRAKTPVSTADGAAALDVAWRAVTGKG